jgi:hypothetical protein
MSKFKRPTQFALILGFFLLPYLPRRSAAARTRWRAVVNLLADARDFPACRAGEGCIIAFPGFVMTDRIMIDVTDGHEPPGSSISFFLYHL